MSPFSLSPIARQAGYRLEVFDTIDSTNALGLERARAGDSGKLWIVSPHQRSGRGRRGRPWSTDPGNLAATLLLRPPVELAAAATLGFVAGLALLDALEAVLARRRAAVGIDGAGVDGHTKFTLKWPNDVLANGAKFSGILLETALVPGSGHALAIGIGVNVVGHPDDLPYPTTSLRTLGMAVDAATLFLALSDAWVDNARLWREGRGLADIRRKWLGRAAGLGSPVAVRTEGDVVRGVFETIDEECRFVIRLADGTARCIAAGDVHFGAVASEARRLEVGV